MLGVAFGAALILNRNLTAPIQALAESVRRIESSGDHTLRAPRTADGEIGLLAEGINHMLDAIEERSTALRHSEERSRTLIRSAPTAIVVLDVEAGRFTEVNENACRLFGLSREELLQHGPIELSRPIQAEGRDAGRYGAELIGRAVAGEAPRFEWIHVAADGREIPCEVLLVRLYSDQRRLICGTILDMTERKRAEEALRRSQTGLEEAQALAHLGSWEVDVATGVAEWSREQCRLMNWPTDQPAPSGDLLLSLVDEADRAAVARFHERLKSGDASGTIEYRTRGEGEAQRLLSVKATVVRDAHGRVIRLAGTTMDVTEQRRLERERRNLEVQLRQAQKLDALGTLAGGIAHDFNNILSAIIGNVELGRSDLGDRESVRECLEEISKAGRRARDLVQRILTFSRRQEHSFDRVTLEPVVQEALKLLRSTLPGRVQLALEVAPGQQPVLADASQIHQVVMNLATNACHALEDEAGTITLRLAPVQVDSRLSKENPDLRPGPYMRLDVTDTGRGMTPATLERIFEPFFTTKPQGKGTGLGLSMVHGIMKAHTGAILVESELNKGTSFRLFFPAVEAAVAPPKIEPGPESVDGAGRHILFVDDEEPLVYLATRMLERMGYRVTGHTNPHAALSEFRARPDQFDLVVTDLSMPGTSGIEVAGELLKIRPDTPVVLVSGYLKEAEIAAALAAGVREVVLKPSTVDKLGTVIQRLMNRKPQN
jgi:PAS domain S-box-containing protein